MIRLYMDENVQAAVSFALVSRGVDVLTAQDDGLGGFDDHTVFMRANELGRVLFSRDRDMVIEAARYQKNGTEFTGVIYARQGLVSLSNCITDLEVFALAGTPEDAANTIFYLPL